MLELGSLPDVVGGLTPFALPGDEDLADPGLLGVADDGGEPLVCAPAMGFEEPEGLVYPKVPWGFFASFVLRGDLCAGGNWQETAENRMAKMGMLNRCSLIFRQ